MSYSPQKPSNIPPEIVYEILTYQFKDFMNNDQPSTSEKFNENLRNFVRSNLTVNKTFYHICRILIYKYCNFTTAKRFHSLLNSITEHPELRNIIQVADFQELTSIGLGRSIEMNREIKNLTNDTLLRFINLTKSNLREFLANCTTEFGGEKTFRRLKSKRKERVFFVSHLKVYTYPTK